MGSFYMTGHSGVITDGQECVLMYVIQIDSVYGQYKPISGPMFCKYSDYGTWELNEESEKTFEDFSDYIKPRLVEFELGKNQYHDIAVNSTLFNWDFTFNMLHETRFKIKTCYDNREVPVKAFAVHRSYFDSIMREYSLEDTREFLMKDYNSMIEKFEALNETERMFFRFRSENENFGRRVNFLEAHEYEGEFWKETFVNFEIKSIYVPEYRLEYLAQAYCFNSFIRNASLDYFPTNYAGQQKPTKEMLIHIKALEQNLVHDFLEDFEENVYGMIYDDYETHEERESVTRMAAEAIKYEKEEDLLKNMLFADLFYRYHEGK